MMKKFKYAFTLAEGTTYVDRKHGKFSFAFTLAEVLITLGIIGVVAAMTMPTLMSSTQRRELQTQLKKTYSEINQISRKYYQENEISLSEYANSESSLENFARTFMSYYKSGSKVSQHTYAEDISNAPYKLFLLSGAPSDTILCDDGGYFSEVGGRVFLFNNLPSGGANGPVMCVDVNGYKGPNKFGMDYFAFSFTNEGFVIPLGQEHRRNVEQVDEEYETNMWTGNFNAVGPRFCRKSGTQALYNSSCAYYALQNISPEDESKTYWGDFINR